MMQTEQYRKFMINIMEMQIKQIEEDMEEDIFMTEERENDLYGRITGLRIAIEKLEASAFLTK